METFLADGWHVVALDRDEMVDVPDGVEAIQCDVSETEQVVAACSRAMDGGPVHALVNNAALQVNQPLSSTSTLQWMEVMNTNVRGPFEAMRELLPALAHHRGAVVNVSSVHAIATSQNICAYAASKGALVALTRAAALEFAVDGVRCNAILPGAVDTQMLQDGLSRREHPDGAEGNLEELRIRTPLQEVASAHDIAKSILYLADTERSPYVTGQALVADGGATARLSTE